MHTAASYILALNENSIVELTTIYLGWHARKDVNLRSGDWHHAMRVKTLMVAYVLEIKSLDQT